MAAAAAPASHEPRPEGQALRREARCRLATGDLDGAIAHHVAALAVDPEIREDARRLQIVLDEVGRTQQAARLHEALERARREGFTSSACGVCGRAAIDRALLGARAVRTGGTGIRNMARMTPPRLVQLAGLLIVTYVMLRSYFVSDMTFQFGGLGVGVVVFLLGKGWEGQGEG